MAKHTLIGTPVHRVNPNDLPTVPEAIRARLLEIQLHMENDVAKTFNVEHQGAEGVAELLLKNPETTTNRWRSIIMTAMQQCFYEGYVKAMTDHNIELPE